MSRKNRVIKICEWCGKEFEIKASHANRIKCCCLECSKKARVGRPMCKTAEDKEALKLKKQLTWASHTEEEKAAYSKKVSDRLLNRTDEEVDEWRNKFLTNWDAKSDEEKQKIIDKRANTCNERGSYKIISDKLTAYYSDEDNRRKVSEKTASAEVQAKINATRRKNNSYHISKYETALYKELVEKYGADDVIREYNDPRYKNPDTGRMFNCDFYIISEDLFIEVNKVFTHGGHPFNPNSEEDQQTLLKWKQKVEAGHNYYQNAITTWTISDPLKFKVAKEAGLNYVTIY